MAWRVRQIRMIVPVLYRCSRCRLRFVPDTDEMPDKCPRCWRDNAMPGQVVVMGRDVTVEVLREYGLEAGLVDRRVRKGLGSLDLGQCRHGYLTSAICSECND